MSHSSGIVVAWSFLTDPPLWVLVILWLSFAYVIFRTVAVGLLRSTVMQAWILARLHGVHIPLYELVTLSLHGHDAKKLVRCCIMSREAGVNIDLQDMTEHDARGGDPETVVMAMVAAKHAGLDLQPQRLFQADLDGANPLAMVEELSADKREDAVGDCRD